MNKKELTDAWLFDDGKFETLKFDFPSDDINESLKTLNYYVDQSIGEENSHHFEIWHSEDAKYPWVVVVQNSSYWYPIIAETLPNYLMLMSLLSPIAMASMLTWFFNDDFVRGRNIIDLFEAVMKQWIRPIPQRPSNKEQSSTNGE